MNGFGFSIYSPYAHLLAAFAPIILVAVLWTIVLKGFSLWYAARAKQKWWFIALLIVNTLGLLEIVYLIWFRPEQSDSGSAPVIHSSSVQ